ncbi:sigma-70 family RNA polymerase sigma factor [Amycolatopsis cynarae]|uniref:Sigma-70 family RNA polymerase sigma factor n=1 Tax=Amycolatopsis cynarae TaxID=2995223 RepID=A0ABY7BA92_9PSEU|nr:sigma-70 family RNA polymerase sigma factor [Amycolatopsis sp. HUAS 11-8]WAL68885.1 sigma-70 family RNA polymerase sigma factor [Amycolatopsis sp. HUAS 11-8]
MTERVDEGEGPPDEDRPRLGGADPAAEFGRLFDRYARPLHRYLARRVGTETADDLVSETFLIALRQRRSYDPAQGAVRSWLYGIATNLLRRHVRDEVRSLRATARAAGQLPQPHPGHDGRVADRVDAAALAGRLAAALAELSEGDRDVLLLSSWAEMDSAQVAETLGIPVGTVRSRLHRVRTRLRATAPTASSKEESHD